MSTSVEVTCGECGQSLGDQFRPGDGIQLYLDHRATCSAVLGVPAKEEQ